MNPSDASYTDSFVIIYVDSCAISVAYSAASVACRYKWPVLDPSRRRTNPGIATKEPETRANEPGFCERTQGASLSQACGALRPFSGTWCGCLALPRSPGPQLWRQRSPGRRTIPRAGLTNRAHFGYYSYIGNRQEPEWPLAACGWWTNRFVAFRRLWQGYERAREPRFKRGSLHPFSGGRGWAARSRTRPDAEPRRSRCRLSAQILALVHLPRCRLESTTASMNFTPFTPSVTVGSNAVAGSGSRPSSLAQISSADPE